MGNKSEKYGTYYGKLVDITDGNTELYLNDLDTNETLKMISDLKSFGAVEILLDVEDDSNYSATLFFEVGADINYKNLMLYITNIRPHEFTEESENCFRMWWD